MNIVEKKCPNCHANLEFNVGEQNVECPHCRRKYAIEYDKDLVDPEVQVLAKDIQLSLLKSFKRSQKVSQILMPFFIIIFVGIFAFVTWTIITTQIDFNKKREEVEKSHQENLERSQEIEDHINQQQKKAQEEQQRIQEEIDKRAAEMEQ